MEEKTIKNFKLNLYNKRYNILYSFLLSAFLMLLYFIFGGMLGGDYIVMRSDLISGGIGGIKEICRDILSGQSIWFSFTTGGGMGNALSVATCFCSPFNILYLILFNVDENIVSAIVIILKVSCISGSFNYFSNKVLKNDNFSSIIISSFYSLCAFTIAYGTIQIIWLDSMIILPLLCASIVDCIEKDKRLLLIILYTYLFVSHFYMGFAVGVFSFVFVVLYAFLIYKNEENKKKIKTKLFNWALSVIIAILLSAVIWVPTLFFILANRVEDSSSVASIDATILQIINSLFWGNGYGIEGKYSYIYCGVPVLILVPLFFMNQDIKPKEKILAGSLIGFYFLCMVFTPLNSFMHVFDQPDCFWYRYSYIVSFLLCSIASRQLNNMRNIKYKHVFTIISVLSILYLLIQQTLGLWSIDEGLKPTQNSNIGFICNLSFLFVWVLTFYLYTKKKYVVSVILSTLVLSVEFVSGSFAETSQKEDSKSYYEWYYYMNEVTNDIKQDKDLYRTLCNNNRYINSDTWFGYNGFSDLGSEEKYSVRYVLSNLGYSTSTRFIDDAGHTPVSEMLMGVKYIIKLPYTVMDIEENEIGEDERYYENENYLGVGYLVSGSTMMYECESRNVFENMNSLVSEMTGIYDDCFDEISQDNINYDLVDMEMKKLENDSIRLKRTEGTGNLYVEVDNEDYSDVYLQIQTNDVGNYVYDFFILGTKNAGNVALNNAKLSAASEMYFDNTTNEYTLSLISQEGASPEKLEFDSINIYGLNREVLKKQYEALYDGRYIIDNWSNGKIDGHVNNSGKRNLLFLSIPYDPGWSAKVNGTDVDIIRLIDGAFMGVYLPGEGEYNISFEYECPGLKIGEVCSLCGFLALLTVIFEKKLKKKNN